MLCFKGVVQEYHQMATSRLHSICLTVALCLQMAAKMGGDQPNMNSSSPVIDPSLYGFGGQKRSLDNGGKPLLQTHNGSAGCPGVSASQPLSDAFTCRTRRLHNNTEYRCTKLQTVCVCVPLCHHLLHPSCKV